MKGDSKKKEEDDIYFEGENDDESRDKGSLPLLREDNDKEGQKNGVSRYPQNDLQQTKYKVEENPMEEEDATIETRLRMIESSGSGSRTFVKDIEFLSILCCLKRRDSTINEEIYGRERKRKSRMWGFFKTLFSKVFCIFVWYILSACVIISNVWLQEDYQFNFPIFITMCHMCMSFLATRLLMSSRGYHSLMEYVCEKMNLVSKDDVDVSNLYFEDQKQKHINTDTFSIVYMDRQRAIYIILLCVTFVGDITFGNEAFRYVSNTSTVEAVGSVSILLVFMVSVATKTETMDFRVLLFVIVIVLGSFVSSMDNIAGHVKGIIFALVSTVLGAFKVVFEARLLEGVVSNSEDGDEDEYLKRRLSPLEILNSFTWIATITLLIICIPVEGSDIARLDHFFGFFSMLGLIILNSLLAFLLNCFALVVIKETSALTYEVLGNFKNIFVYILAVSWTSEEVNNNSVYGGIILLAGVISYTVTRMLILRKKYSREEAIFDSLSLTVLRREDAGEKGA